MPQLAQERGGAKDCRKGVVGGTFSLLHRGHRHLLSFAALHSERLVVGVTSDEYVKARKTHPVEPFELRALAVLLFVKTVDPGVSVEVVPIDDAYGPAIADAEVDCIFVSEETLLGALAVNLVRRLRGFSALTIYVVDTVPHASGERLSSTLLWRQLAAYSAPRELDNQRHENDPQAQHR